MPRRKNTSAHPVTLASGRVLGPGETAEVADGDAGHSALVEPRRKRAAKPRTAAAAPAGGDS